MKFIDRIARGMAANNNSNLSKIINDVKYFQSFNDTTAYISFDAEL